jgi:hypothetical protein
MKQGYFRKGLICLLAACFLAVLIGCGAGDAGNGTSTPTTPTTQTTTPTALDLSASPTSVKSDGSTSSTITVNALNASNAILSDVTVTLNTDSGVLGSPSVVTNSTTPATVTFNSGGNRINRTATITATVGTVSAQIPVQVTGSTVTLTPTGTTLPDDGTSPVTCTITARDAGSNVIQGAAVTLTKTGGGGNVTITPGSATWTTGSDGTFTATVAGVGAGAVTLTATALGATAATALTVNPTAATFAIDQLNGKDAIDTTAMKIGESLVVRVNAPAPAANVTFAATTGAWNGTGSSVVTVPVAAGKATATLTTTQAGIANVQVYDQGNPATSDNLTVAMTSGASAYSIVLQASPTVVPRSVGTTTGSSTLIAMVRDASNYPISDVPVSFSIVKPTSGGETVSPVVVLTAATISGGLSLGEARATFTSGALSSPAEGVQVRAAVVGTAVETEAVGANGTPSGNDAAITIGGVAGSVAFGQATLIGVLEDKATYSWPMSVLVADSNGNKVPDALVSLSAWPIAWSTGQSCTYDADIDPSSGNHYPNQGTFWNEDVNENLFLDPGEDGTRKFYADNFVASGAGKIDTYSTPVNSAGGVLPATVTTDSNGVAAFTLNYPKQSAIWTLVRIRASTVVAGSETRGEIILRLSAIVDDVVPCRLGDSPYTF